MPRALLFLAGLALTVFAIVEVAQSDEHEPSGLPKAVWILIIVLVPVAGPVAWFLASRYGGTRRGTSAQTGFPAGPVPPAQYQRRPRTWETDGPSAADDDPEMRWLLEQARLKREREQSSRPAEPAQDDDERDATTT